MTATEWAAVGGYKEKLSQPKQHVPFECCALSLVPFESPACTSDGVLFDVVAILEFIKKHGTSPVTGEPLNSKDVIRLKMKRQDQKWMCPLTYRVFGKHSKVAAIRTTGNVYSHEALKELCFSGTMEDPIDGTSFEMKDVIILHDPDNEELCQRRDMANFALVKQEKEPTIRMSETALRNEKIVAEARATVRKRDNDRPVKRAKIEENLTETFQRVISLKPRTSDVLEGSFMSSGKTSRAATSSAVDIATNDDLREATREELWTARTTFFRKHCHKKRGYVRLETSCGPLNFELRYDVAPRACENFLGLCQNGYYDNVKFHRVIRGFIAQAGDPTGKGDGGDSLWGGPFSDEIDTSRLKHDARGVLSMANSGGKNQNKSQFFITFASASHLDGRHTIFGKLVGGNETLDTIENLPVKESDDHRPRHDVSIHRSIVFVDPIPDADLQFEAHVKTAIDDRLARDARRSGHPSTTKVPPSPVVVVGPEKKKHSSLTIGKYLPSNRR